MAGKVLGRFDIGGGVKVHNLAKMCAGTKFRARGAPAKTRYCGHYFSRLMQDLSQHVQTDCLAYYMGEGQSREQGIWGYYWVIYYMPASPY